MRFSWFPHNNSDTGIHKLWVCGSFDIYFFHKLSKLTEIGKKVLEGHFVRVYMRYNVLFFILVRQTLHLVNTRLRK